MVSSFTVYNVDTITLITAVGPFQTDVAPVQNCTTKEKVIFDRTATTRLGTEASMAVPIERLPSLASDQTEPYVLAAHNQHTLI